MVGINVPREIYIHVSGIDLVRDSRTGEYLVLEDNARSPSGISYVLENRLVVARMFPELFKECQAQPLAPFFDRHDVLVMPTLARPCPAARRYGERSWLRSVATSLMFAPMTGVWNLAGFPAASVPAGGPGMPGAVQLVAAPGGEQALLALAAQLERAPPWPRHAPGYSGSLRPSWEASKPRDS